jgi:hypothetical protein
MNNDICNHCGGDLVTIYTDKEVRLECKDCKNIVFCAPIEHLDMKEEDEDAR